MTVLVDTSVWVDHFKHRNAELVQLLKDGMVLIHPMILGEIACGTPPSPRQRTLSDLGLLPHTHQINIPDVMAFIDSHDLYGRGCGLVDMSLLASTMITPGARLWTLDKRLEQMAHMLNVAYDPTH